MPTGKYTTQQEGEWVYPIRKRFKLMCCSCGLVHVVDFRLRKNGRGAHIEYRLRRDERATAQARRHKLQILEE